MNMDVQCFCGGIHKSPLAMCPGVVQLSHMGVLSLVSEKTPR